MEKNVLRNYGEQMLKLYEKTRKELDLTWLQVTLEDGKAIFHCTCEIVLAPKIETEKEPELWPAETAPSDVKPVKEEKQKPEKKVDGQKKCTDAEILEYLKKHPGQSTHSYELELHTSKERLKRIMKANGIKPNTKRGWSLKGTPPNKGKRFVEKEPEEKENRIPLRLDDIPAPKIDDKVKSCAECECWNGNTCLYHFQGKSSKCKPYRQKRLEI